ncbi:MAG TPA: FAD-dependent oxidoreductase [Fontimonas sp.]
MESCDVAVVGAGFAGLRAASLLRAAGRSVRLIEARDRVGGRSMPGVLNGRTLDLGGQWVGVRHDRLRALAAEAGAALLPQYVQGDKLLQTDDRIRRYSGLIPPVSPTTLVEMQLALSRLRSLQERVSLEAPWDSRDAEALDRMSVDAWQSRWLHSKGARALMDIAVRAVFCATPRQLSMLGFLHYLRANENFDAALSTDAGAQALTVDGGMHSLSRHLAASLGDVLQLNRPLQRIEQGTDDAQLHFADGTLRARRVIVAMSPQAAGRIACSPWMPAREQLAQRMPMGSVIKCLIAYRTPFWRAQGLTGEFVSTHAAFSPVFDVSPADGSHGALIGFFDGPDAVRWSAATPEARKAEVIATLVRAYGADAAHYIDYVDYDWIADPYSRGCYTGLWTPGTMTEVGRALRAPVGRIHWAGTETAEAWCGYIEGALLSGERAAKEVGAALS